MMLKNLTIERNLVVDNSLFIIENRDVDVKFPVYPQIIISFSDIIFNNNLHVVSESYSQIAPIKFFADNSVTFVLQNVSFANNSLFTYEGLSTMYKSSSILILSALRSAVFI